MIERGSDGGHVLKLNKGLLFAQKRENINVSRSTALKLDLVPARRYNCGVMLSSHTLMFVPSFIRIERGSGFCPYVLKLNKVPRFARKPVNINGSRSAAPKSALMPASRYNCDAM